MESSALTATATAKLAMADQAPLAAFQPSYSPSEGYVFADTASFWPGHAFTNNAATPISSVAQHLANHPLDSDSTWTTPTHGYLSDAIPRSLFLPDVPVRPWSEFADLGRVGTASPSDPDVDFASLLNDDFFDDDNASELSAGSNTSPSISDATSFSTHLRALSQVCEDAGAFSMEAPAKRRKMSRSASQQKTLTTTTRRSPRARKSRTLPDFADKELSEGSLSPKPNDALPKNKHTLVERKYRRSLNDRFTELLRVLPATEGDAPTAGPEDAEAKRAMKKGKILELARSYITELEKKHESVEQERINLERKVEIYQEALRGLGMEENE